MTVRKSVTISDEQQVYIKKNCLSASKLLQEKIDEKRLKNSGKVR